jgi:hypothetical protein
MTTFYHGSFDELAIGTVLEARPRGYVGSADPDLENLFERVRPEGCIPRQQAVFLVADPDLIDAAGGYTDFIYEVEAVSPRSHDLAWYTQAQILLDDGDIPGAEEAARNYWDGVPYPKRSSSLIEYLVRSATVVAEFEEDCGPGIGR